MRPIVDTYMRLANFHIRTWRNSSHNFANEMTMGLYQMAPASDMNDASSLKQIMAIVHQHRQSHKQSPIKGGLINHQSLNFAVKMAIIYYSLSSSWWSREFLLAFDSHLVLSFLAVNLQGYISSTRDLLKLRMRSGLDRLLTLHAGVSGSTRGRVISKTLYVIAHNISLLGSRY